MPLDIDLDYNDRIVSGAGTKDKLALLEFKRDTSGEIPVRFWRAGIQVELADGAVGFCGIKPRGEYDADPLVYAGEWTKTGTGDTTLYTFYPEFDGVALAALLGSGNDDVSDDVPVITGMFEIKWVADGKKHRTQSVDTLIYNDILKDPDGTPSAFPALWAAPLELTAPPVQGVAAVSQVETATVVAPAGCTSNGSVIMAVTAAGVTGSPLALTAPITTATHTTAALIAGAMRTALQASAALTALYTVGGAGVYVTLTRINPAANDATLNLQIAGGYGVTGAVSSANTTTGVALVLGTVATALGQLAIVTTTNDSGTFKDNWVAAALSPVAWNPPGNIYKDRTTGFYHRQFFDGGTPIYELAYP
ncbi:MAG: hypothetical protein ABIT37_01595 [Luteolibacter sp.]